MILGGDVVWRFFTENVQILAKRKHTRMRKNASNSE